jgi:hypothetical protein
MFTHIHHWIWSYGRRLMRPESISIIDRIANTYRRIAEAGDIRGPVGLGSLLASVVP